MSLLHIRVERDYEFSAGIHFGGKFYVNSYHLTVSMQFITNDEYQQTVAIDRMSHFIYNVLSNTVFVDSAEIEQIQKYQHAGISVVELAEEPFDQLIAMVLTQKLNSIVENRLYVEKITLTSSLSDGIRYSVPSELVEEVFGDNSWWWNKSDLSISNETQTNNIIPLFGQDEWTELNLGWKENGQEFTFIAH